MNSLHNLVVAGKVLHLVSFRLCVKFLKSDIDLWMHHRVFPCASIISISITACVNL
jgi:hypothetical protein